MSTDQKPAPAPESFDLEERIVDDGGDLRAYRTELPNMLEDSTLDPYEVRLYVHYKRRAGDSGGCYESMRQIAKLCRMSLGQVSKARKSLIERKWIRLGTITIDEQTTLPCVRIVNIWDANFARYAKRKRSLSEQSDSESVHSSVHTVNDKKEHEKEGTEKKGRRRYKRKTKGKEIPLPVEMRTLTDEMRAAAEKYRLQGVDIEAVHETLVANADRDGLLYVNWLGAWCTYLVNALTWGKRDGTLAPPDKQTAWQTVRERREAQKGARAS